MLHVRLMTRASKDNQMDAVAISGSVKVSSSLWLICDGDGEFAKFLTQKKKTN